MACIGRNMVTRRAARRAVTWVPRAAAGASRFRMMGTARPAGSAWHGLGRSEVEHDDRRDVTAVSRVSLQAHALGITTRMYTPLGALRPWQHQRGLCSAVPPKSDTQKQAEKQVGRLRALVRNYGAVGVATYGGIYVGTLALLYGLVEQDVIGAGDAVSMLRYTGLNNFVDMTELNPRAGNFALAWILTKFTEPLRLVLAISITPAIARGIGWAPPKPASDSAGDATAAKPPGPPSAPTSSNSPRT